MKRIFRQNLVFLSFLLIVAFGLLGLLWSSKNTEWFTVTYKNTKSQVVTNGGRAVSGVNNIDQNVITIADVSIPVEVKRTPTELRSGLSGRPSLDSDTGMLFVFKTKALHPFWMPDMNFPIDIVWITDGAVVGVNKRVSNEFNYDHPVFYKPPVPVDYVLEVNSGFLDQHKLRVGDKVNISLSS